MVGSLLNGSIFNYFGIVDALKNLDPKNNRYHESQWNYYTSTFAPINSTAKIFGNTTSFLENASSYGINSPLDAVAAGMWQSGLGTASGSPFLSHRSSVGNYDASLGSTLYTVANTHLDALNYDDKWLRTQAGAIVQASEALRPYVTKDNQDGTYNLTINPGATGLGTSGLRSQIYQWDEGTKGNSDIRTSVSYVDGPSKALSYENIKLFDDVSAAYDYVRNESSFLRNIKEAALKWSGVNTNPDPTGEMARLGRANAAQELNYANESNLKSRRAKIDQYKRNKATSQRLSATSAGAPGTGGSDSEDALKLGIPTLLGL